MRKFSGLKAMVVLYLAVFVVEAASAGSEFDSVKAAKTFKKCQACHELGPDASNSVGPHLSQLLNRPVGSVEGGNYSKALRRFAATNALWDSDNLNQFLTKPKAFIKGTSMSFAGLKDDEERENLINWLFSQSPEVSESAPLELAALSVTGDPEYGEYLSGECLTCHQVSGGNDGIPGIIGWPKESFIQALYEYKTGVRENSAMVTVSKRLGDEEMAALAAYFGKLQKQ